ncbi:unnamed protein product [Ectocarpus sp. 4 AP-2014]
MASTCTRTNHLTVDKVGSMTTFELRQEAETRGLLEDMPHVNHSTLLQRIVQVLVEEEHERGRQSALKAANFWYSDPDKTTEEKDRLRQERSERKAAATERSKQRQANHGYFHAKRALNVREQRQQPVQESYPRTDEDQDAASSINPRRHKIFVR